MGEDRCPGKVVAKKLGIDDELPTLLESASRHGIAESDAVHAWAFSIDAYMVDDGFVTYLGPDRAENLLEAGVVEWHGQIPIVHAMRARPRFLR